jgi:hypothetical protein
MAERHGVVFIAADVHHGGSEVHFGGYWDPDDRSDIEEMPEMPVRRTPSRGVATELMTSGFGSMVVAIGGQGVVRCLSRPSPMMKASGARCRQETDTQTCGWIRPTR